MEQKDIPDYPLFKEEIDQLNNIIRSNEPHHVRNCAQGILYLFLYHYTYEYVANLLKVHSNTVRNWAERWYLYDIDGLYYLPGRGAKPMFSIDEEEIIIECLNDTPKSLRAVADKVAQITGKHAHVVTIRNIIKKHGKIWKRQRKVPKGKPTEQEYEQGKAEIEELKELAQDGEFDLRYFDAAGFNLTPDVPYAWQDIGRDGTIEIPASLSERINVTGFLNPVTNELTAQEHKGTINSDVIIEVMDNFCDNLKQPAVVILDNASVHTSKKVSEKRKEWEDRGLTLYFLPPYSPQLNLIEILWRKMKYEWIPNWAYDGITSLRIAIRDIIKSFGSTYTIQFS